MLNFSLLRYKLVSLFIKHYYKIKGSKNCPNDTALYFIYNYIISDPNHVILGLFKAKMLFYNIYYFHYFTEFS